MRRTYMGCRLVLAIVLCAGLALPVSAQQPPATRTAPAPAAGGAYLKLDPLPSLWKDGKATTEAATAMRQVQNILKGEPLGQNEARFDSYFTRYIFPLMTGYTDEDLAQLPRRREAFLRDYLRLSGLKPEPLERLVSLTFTSMKDIVQKNYHPAVRYNAMLIIGELNTNVWISPSSGVPAPLAEARTFMLGELVDPKQADVVKVAALLGLLRHADLNAQLPADRQFPASVRTAMVKQLLPLATERKPPAGRSEEGHGWIRARTVELLAALGQAGADPEIVQALERIVGDSSEPTTLRYVAATSLGRLNLGSINTVASDELTRRWAELLIETSRSQLARLDEEINAEKERLKREGISERSIGIYGGSTSTTTLKQEQRLLLVRRTLKDNALKVLYGIRSSDTSGAISAAKGKKDYVTTVAKAVQGLSGAADIKEPTINNLAKEMRARINELERVVKTGGGRTVPATPATPPAAELPGEEEPELPGAPAATVPAVEEPEAPEAPEAPGEEVPEIPEEGPAGN